MRAGVGLAHNLGEVRVRLSDGGVSHGRARLRSPASIAHPVGIAAGANQVAVPVEVERVNWQRDYLTALSPTDFENVKVAADQTYPNETREDTSEDSFDGARPEVVLGSALATTRRSHKRMQPCACASMRPMTAMHTAPETLHETGTAAFECATATSRRSRRRIVLKRSRQGVHVNGDGPAVRTGCRCSRWR